ncbi:MAG: hypothetical protein AB7D41_03405 [Arcobacter sp.]|uniref:hypothetical protein n=1 Tax=Arcobacter sp. TaxID=1872629 RepID=UPI003CFCB3FC
MPQLIAMIIVVVGAMIYMFQTFGGTGDKIEGIAQKTSIITEINNIKDGLQLAVRSNEILHGTELEALAKIGYFAKQINDQILNSADNTAGDNNYNIYKAISFGGSTATGDADLELSLVTPDAANQTAKPGIFVDLSKGNLKDNVNFLESQIATDLGAVASIDRTSTDTTAVTLDANGDVPKESAPTTVTNTAGVAGTITAGAASLSDGRFTIYFKDIPQGIE